MTLKLKDDIDILKMYLRTKIEVARHSKLRAWIEKYENMFPGQRSKSNVTNFQYL